MELKTIAVLEGDQTGQELLEESLRVLEPDVIGLDIDLPRFDLSLDFAPHHEKRGSSTGGPPRSASTASAPRPRR